MPTTYLFKDSRTADQVAKALLFVAKFSKKQALVKFSDCSIGIIWGGSPKMYYIHAEYAHLDMFRNKLELRNMSCGLEPCTVIQVDPTILGKTLKGGSPGTERRVSLQILRPSQIHVLVESNMDTGKRLITHKIPCDLKTLDDYKSMLIEEIETPLCRYHTSSYIESIHRLKHIMDSFVRLGTPRVYIQSKQLDDGNEVTILARTQNSDIRLDINELENEIRSENLGEFERERRTDAAVSIDTRGLAMFLAGLNASRRSRVLFDIEHNKCLKVTLQNEITQGETFFQSMLMLHKLV